MSHLDSLLSGLLGALSWENGVDNVLVGGPPTPLYLVGLSCHFLFGSYLLYRLGKPYWIAFKKVGFWKAYGLVIVQAKSFGKFRYVLSMMAVYLLLFGAFPYYLTYRFTNGIWRYHYFTSQVVQEEKALMTNIDAYVGTGKSTYSKVEADLMPLGGRNRPIHVSNSSQSLASWFRSLQYEKSLHMVLVEVNEEGTVVFIK